MTLKPVVCKFSGNSILTSSTSSLDSTSIDALLTSMNAGMVEIRYRKNFILC